MCLRDGVHPRIQNFIFNFKSYIQISPEDFALALQESSRYSNVFNEIFSLSWAIPNTINNNFTSFFYSPLTNPFLFFPFIYIIFSFIRFYKKFRTILYFLLFILLLVFFTAGSSSPLGKVYLLMMEHIPFFIYLKHLRKNLARY